MSKIALIDDDVYIGNMIAEVLVKEGHQVLMAFSGTEALLLLKQEFVDLVLLDLMLPGMDGEEVLKNIKKGIPVIVISAKGETEDKVQLLMDGAMDYVTKPFDLKELLARIAVQLRGRQEEHHENTLAYYDLLLHLDQYTVSEKDRTVKLTKTEFAILKLLMKNPRQVYTKSLLLQMISEDTLDGSENSLKMHVKNLRAKLRQISDRDYIEAVWGIGYKLRERE